MSSESTLVYEQAMALVESGKHAEALVPLMQYVRANPDDVQAMNDAGAVLYCLGRYREAASFLERALASQPSSAEIAWNLVEVYLALGEPAKLVAILPLLAEMKLLTPDLFNRAANTFLDKGDVSGALQMLIQSLELAPNQEVLRPMIEVIRSKRPRIAFFCGMGNDTKFLTDILDSARQRYPVRCFEGTSVDEMYKLMQWSDISWFEWCTDLPVKASQLEKACKMIVRLHRFEAYQEWPRQVNWNNVDTLVLVGNTQVKAALARQVPDIDRRTRIVTIPNGIDLKRYGFVDRPRGKNIACVGYLNMRKNPMFLLQCMQKLHYIDPGYRLFFAGNFQDAMLEQYVMDMVRALGLQQTVFFSGWQTDIASWLEDKHYIVSASIGESQGLGILEGMARGLCPVIHRFPGVEEIFPAEYVFNIAEEFCRRITESPYEPAKYRRFVEETYPLKKQLDAVDGIFAAFEAELAEHAQPVA